MTILTLQIQVSDNMFNPRRINQILRIFRTFIICVANTGWPESLRFGGLSESN